MGVVVQKYGGSSVADVERIRRVAERIVRAREQGHQVVVVVSAMGNTTNELLALARRITPDPTRRELDMLLSVGERISMALLSMAVNALGFEAVSFTGSQSGIITNTSHARARIIEVRPFRIQDELDQGRIVIVAGYQGVSYRREITTLGRGGSDLTAVALAAALDAEYCEICSDVDGVLTADPRVVDGARRIDEMTHDEMLELARAGAKVLNADAVEHARRNGIAIYARATFGGASDTGTIVRKDLDTTPRDVTAVAGRKDHLLVRAPAGTAAAAWARYRDVLAALGPDDPGPVSSRVDGGSVLRASLLFVTENVPEPAVLADRLSRSVPGAEVTLGMGSATVVGPALASAPHVLSLATEALADLADAVWTVETSPCSIRFLLPAEHVDEAVSRLHERLISVARRQ